MLPLYLLVCSFSFGLINLAPLFEIPTPFGEFNAEDILLIALLILSAPAYLRQRHQLASPWFRRVELAWLFFVFFLAVQSFRSPAFSLTERLMHVRFVQGYLLFFPSVAVMTSRERLRKIALVGLFLALAGTMLTIAQSLHGLDNLFDSPFYDIGAWGGNKQIVGGLTRVNLPGSNWVAFVLLVLFGLSLLQFHWRHLVVGGFLSIAIGLNFARSLWLGIATASLLEVALLIWIGGMRKTRVLRLAFMPLVLILGLLLAPYIGLGGFRGALAERVNEGVVIISTRTGTWAGRLDAVARASYLLEKNLWWGVGTAYHSVVGEWVEIGFYTVLISTGIVGLVIEALFFLICSLAGCSVLKEGAIRNSMPLMIAGVLVPVEITLIVVYQAWLHPTSFAILGLASALAVVIPTISRSSDQDALFGLDNRASFAGRRTRGHA